LTPTLVRDFIQAFVRTLAPGDHQALAALLAGAQQTPPADHVRLRCGAQILGTMAPTHAHWLATVLENCEWQENKLVWNAGQESPERRSQQLQSALVRLRDLGRVAAWRDEAFCFWPQSDATPDPRDPEFLRIERAGFRFLGMMSHAVHINGFTPDGRLWCGQRSAAKATDPGLWDNLTAGGLSAGESLADCALRELWEEAGFNLRPPAQTVCAGRVRIARNTPTGWHDEMLHIYNLALPADFVPQNQDGEVQGFACLSGPQMMAQLHAQQFTHDAALAIAQSVQSTQNP
jgi:ADP-ribose pyrophosphatase YjhB (NUDIX family)